MLLLPWSSFTNFLKALADSAILSFSKPSKHQTLCVHIIYLCGTGFNQTLGNCNHCFWSLLLRFLHLRSTCSFGLLVIDSFLMCIYIVLKAVGTLFTLQLSNTYCSDYDWFVFLWFVTGPPYSPDPPLAFSVLELKTGTTLLSYFHWLPTANKDRLTLIFLKFFFMITGNTRKYFVDYSVKSTFLETNGRQNIKERKLQTISLLSWISTICMWIV